MDSVVIDANVLIIANGDNDASRHHCEQKCIEALKRAREQCVLVDSGWRILREYRNNLPQHGPPRTGFEFYKWLCNTGNSGGYRIDVLVTPIPEDELNFTEFPADPNLRNFDRSDRVYVAVALASKREPEVLNASDTDWWNYREPLSRNGLNVRFLCQELMPS